MDAELILDAATAAPTVETTIAALPPEAPLAMPVQDLRASARAPRPASAPRSTWLRRLLVIGGAIALTGAGVWQMDLVLAGAGLTPLAAVMLVLFTALFAWIALSFTSALAGFVVVLCGGGRRLGVGHGAPPHPATRTALLMPCYNESPARVMAALQAMWEALRDAGAEDSFDLFILSDTTEPEVWIEEEAAFLALRRRTGSGRIFYRHRKHNTARKSGNIADWVTRWGGTYPQFLILDADSVMQAETLLHLVGAMERHADVGLIQTLPIITGGSTLFARLQQFAGRVYGPLIAQGIAWWHGAEGNYWGHNALIRTRAFADHAGLPELRGRKPFGGHIMSHDFVEAALIRRAGWAVHMVPGLAGSFEESPPSLVDLAVRDRRWCQGNLQHLAVLPSRGLHWVSRLHMLTGVGSYVTAPLWLLFLLAGILISLQARFIPPSYFPENGKSLFPLWPVVDPVRAKWMFVGTMGLLLVPKLFGCVLVLIHGVERRGFGGGVRLIIGVLLESLIAGLLAPIVMLTQTVDIAAIMIGRDSGWNPQRRDDGSVPLRDTFRKYRRHTLVGVALGVAAWLVSTSLAAWMLPVVAGLALAIPLVQLTSARTRALTRAGILRIPEEIQPPVVLTRTRRLAIEFAAEIGANTALPSRLLQDEALFAAHRDMLPPPRRAWVDPPDVPLLTGRLKLAEAPDAEAAWKAMSRAERSACLADSEALDLLASRSTF